jgi:hypothetical protein
MVVAGAVWWVLLQASAATPIRVERTAQAESCPSGNVLVQRVALQCPKTPVIEGERPAFVVRFQQPTEQRFVGSLEGAFGIRTLNAEEGTCDGLAAAVTVTVCLLLRDPAVREPPPLPAQRAILLSPSGGLMVPLLDALSPHARLELGLEVPRFRVTVGATATLPTERPAGPGAVALWAWAGTARAGPWFRLLPWLRVWVFGGVALGSVVGSGRQFVSTRSTAQWWLWAEAGGSVGLQLWPWVSIDVTASLLAHLRRPQFSVDGQDAVFTMPLVSGAFTLGPTFRVE